MKTIWAWVGLISGALPGVGLILFRLGTPEELRAPLGVIGVACGPLAFGIHYILRSKNKKIVSKHTFAIRATVWGLVAVIAFSAYWIIVNRCVVKESGNSEAFFPLFLIGKAAKDVANAGGYRSFYQLFGPFGVARLLEDQSLPIVASYVILISLFSLGSVAMPVSIGLLYDYGQRLDVSPKTSKTKPPQPLAAPPQHLPSKIANLAQTYLFSKAGERSILPAKTPAVFISYAHTDKRWLDRFVEFLKPLVRQEGITLCSDQDIKIGENWHERIQAQLNGVQAVVLLVSSAFLASDYIANSELPVILKNAADHGVKIFPVLISPSLFERAKYKYPNPETGTQEFTLSSLQAVNPPSKTLVEMTEGEQNRVLLEVADQLAGFLSEDPQ